MWYIERCRWYGFENCGIVWTGWERLVFAVPFLKLGDHGLYFVRENTFDAASIYRGRYVEVSRPALHC